MSWLLGFLVVGVALGEPGEPTQESEPADAEERLSWYALPTAGFDTDDGFGVGARFEMARLTPDAEPYLWSLVVQGYTTVTGYHHHQLRMDRTGLGRLGRLRLTSHMAWRQWSNAGYWGMGNGTLREAAFVGSFERDDPARLRYRYRLVQPFVRLTARHSLGGKGGWEAFGAFEGKLSQVTAPAGSVLEEEQPYGMAGGPSVQLVAGTLFDTRSAEVAPTDGVLIELAGRIAPDIGAEGGGFVGAFASARGFASPHGRVVLAGRVMGEWLVGDVPFFEMVHWAGLRPISGMGGYETLRGASFGRYHAPGKAVLNSEVRVAVFELELAERPITLEAAPWVDVGLVFGDGVAVREGLSPVHPGVGVGGRIIFDRTFVGRLDLGWASDPILQADGSTASAWNLGFYLTFDHSF